MPTKQKQTKKMGRNTMQGIGKVSSYRIKHWYFTKARDNVKNLATLILGGKNEGRSSPELTSVFKAARRASDSPAD